MKMRKTVEFIEKAIKVHGDKYDYSQSYYDKAHSKVTILCKEHGPFSQKPVKHLSGQGCPACARYKRKPSLTNETFIEKAISVHGDKYDYSSTSYTKTHSKVTILCKEHGPFSQMPSNHLRGAGCPKCSGGVGYSEIEFIEKAIKVHGDKYDYSDVFYSNSQNKVTILCKEHGPFSQIPASHLKGYGCPRCGRIARDKTLEETYGSDYKKIIANKSVETSKTNHQGVHHTQTHISENTWKILNSKDELGMLYRDLGGYRTAEVIGVSPRTVYDAMIDLGIAPLYYDGRSFSEKEIEGVVREIYAGEVIIGDREILGGREIDILIPSKKVGIEFNGVFWHSDKFKENDYHQKKALDCMNQGIQLIQVWEDDWNDPVKKNIIKNKIKAKLGFCDKRVYARDTRVMGVGVDEAREFLNNTHIQGYVPSDYTGLYHKDELVAVMGMKRKGDKHDLTRFSTSCVVVGGFSKLLSHWKKTNEWKEIFTYAHLDYSHGDLYEKTGFCNDGTTPPNYWYIHKSHPVRESRQKFMKHKLKSKLASFDPCLTERQNMINNGYFRVYDSGSIKFYMRNL